METYKRAKVVLETSNKRSKLALCYSTKTTGFETDRIRALTVSNMRNTTINDGLGFFLQEKGLESPIFKDIYITVEDSITKGDWYINHVNGEFNGIFQAETKIYKEVEYRTWSETNRKVIGTSNHTIVKASTLPNISDSFIERYVEKYNTPREITDVLVENKIVEFTSTSTKRGTIKGTASMFKVNKDNTLIIKKLKEQFTREEMIENMWLAYKAADTIFEGDEALRYQFEQWFNSENF